MTARRPDMTAIDDYVTGHMPDDEAAEFEEALFGEAGAELSLVDQLARAAAFLVPRGTYHAGTTRAELDRLIAAGYRVQIRDFGRPGRHFIDFAVDGDLFVSRFDLGVRDLALVDFEIEVPPHGIVKVIRDVKVDPREGAVYGLCEPELAAAAYAVPRSIFRAITHRDGRRVVVGEYELTKGT